MYVQLSARCVNSAEQSSSSFVHAVCEVTSVQRASPPCGAARPRPSKSLCVLDSLWPVPLPHHVQPCKSEYFNLNTHKGKPAVSLGPLGTWRGHRPTRCRVGDFNILVKGYNEAEDGFSCVAPNVGHWTTEHTVTFLSVKKRASPSWYLPLIHKAVEESLKDPESLNIFLHLYLWYCNHSWVSQIGWREPLGCPVVEP